MAKKKHDPQDEGSSITRWEKWFSGASLSKDDRILSAPPSLSAVSAAQVFRARRKRTILDLACGVGRDTWYLEAQGLNVTGVDASTNGLQAARQARHEKKGAPKLAAGDARRLPFKDDSFEGVYCFGLLHEFTNEHSEISVETVMKEIGRLLQDKGVLVLSVLSGEPESGLPDVRLFSQQMYSRATGNFQRIEVKEYDDFGCTGRPDYRIWYGVFLAERRC